MKYLIQGSATYNGIAPFYIRVDAAAGFVTATKEWDLATQFSVEDAVALYVTLKDEEPETGLFIYRVIEV
jgi:hypothetical protein